MNNKKALLERIERTFNMVESDYFSNNVSVIIRDVGKLKLTKSERLYLQKIREQFNYDCRYSALNALRCLYHLLSE